MPEIVVSAIIPTYNRADLVGCAVQSALDQSVPNGAVEVIVVDDESTDTTPDVLARFGSRIRSLRQTNRREGAARNLGASAARGVYLAFLDSDDYWLPGKLAADVARSEAADHPALVYSRALNVDSLERPMGVRRLPTYEGDVFWWLAREAFMPMSTVAVRADAFRACGGFQEDRALSGTADWELWLRIAARWPVGFVEQTATCIRVHPRRMLADHGYMEGAMLSGVRHALADPVVAKRARGRERAIWAWMYTTIALHAYLNGRRTQSWRWLARGVATWPPQLMDRRVWGAAARSSLGPAVLGRLKRLGSEGKRFPSNGKRFPIDGKRLPAGGKRLPVSAYHNDGAAADH